MSSLFLQSWKQSKTIHFHNLIAIDLHLAGSGFSDSPKWKCGIKYTRLQQMLATEETYSKIKVKGYKTVIKFPHSLVTRHYSTLNSVVYEETS